jgi:hypothetical protein
MYFIPSWIPFILLAKQFQPGEKIFTVWFFDAAKYKKNGHWFPLPDIFSKKNLHTIPNSMEDDSNVYFIDLKTKYKSGLDPEINSKSSNWGGSKNVFSISKTQPYLYSFSDSGNKYLRYQKYNPNMKIEFFTRSNRKFWELSDTSYPIMNPTGNLNILLSSNNSRIHFINSDGQFLNSVSGPFFIDYANVVFKGKNIFKEKKKKQNSSESFNIIQEYSAIAFLHGIVTLVDRDGEVIFYRDNNNYKYKSVALSPNGQFLLLHGKFIDGSDFIELIETDQNKSIYLHTINVKIPHKLYMAVNNFGDAVINFPQAAILADSSGEIVAKYNAKKKRSTISVNFLKDHTFQELQFPKDYIMPKAGIYHPVTTNGHEFFISREKVGLIIRKNGSLIHSISKIRKSSPWRFLFSGDGKILFIQDGDILRYYFLEDGGLSTVG